MPFTNKNYGVMYSLILTAYDINVCTYVDYLHGTRYCTDSFHRNKNNRKIKGFIINFPCQIDRAATVILLLSQFYIRKRGTFTNPRMKTWCYIIITRPISLVLQVEDPIVSFSCPPAVFSVFPCCATQILCYIIRRKTFHIHLVSAIFTSVTTRNNVSSNFYFCQWISIQFIVNSSFRRTNGIFILQWNRTGTSTGTKLKV